mgnify:CR=1 FL=1
MTTGPIPLTAIQDYADRHELGEMFVRQMLEIDRQYVKEQAKDMKQAGNNNG